MEVITTVEGGAHIASASSSGSSRDADQARNMEQQGCIMLLSRPPSPSCQLTMIKGAARSGGFCLDRTYVHDMFFLAAPA
ncbi:hypothetical protein [Bosea massiliensis]|uniref:Uncharacterized protein n=1 Tax=Bosea massiliensis TaxID=151419 RepID=A0ABW0P8H1_9HYPH